jgi:prepilin-type N-terminal cleavage/methylation domain-containing protein
VELGLVCMSAGVRSSRRARRARGFSLIELMVVIMIIGLLAALAAPTMAASRIDRNAYDDAGSIMQLLRSARTRAVARGSAVLVSMTFNGTANRGTFAMYEAVRANATGIGQARTPVSSCKSPTSWTVLSPANTGVVLLDGLDLNGTIETDFDIETDLRVYNTDGSVTSGVTAGFLCFTPLGRVYFVPGTTAVFDGVMPVLTPLEFRVQRLSGGLPVGTIRSVLLPPNGSARLFSHT